MSVPKWTEERTEKLEALVGDESPVSQDTIASVAEELETSVRSVSSKLRKMGYDVALASEGKTKAFTDEEAAELGVFVDANAGELTYGEIAEAFAGGKFNARQIQGKILSMEKTGSVKPTPKAESQRTYTDEEEGIFLGLVAKEAYLEDIAEALGRPLNSVRGKALSFLRMGEIEAIPKQKNSNASAKVDALEALGDVSAMTVEAIAEAIDKTARGVKTMLTRRGITCADHDGAAKKAKNDA